MPLIINDNKNVSINELCKEAEEAFKTKNIKIIYIDVFGLINPEDGNQLYVVQYSTNIRKLKMIAQELNISVVVNCELPKDVEHTVPNLQSFYVSEK